LGCYVLSGTLIGTWMTGKAALKVGRGRRPEGRGDGVGIARERSGTGARCGGAGKREGGRDERAPGHPKFFWAEAGRLLVGGRVGSRALVVRCWALLGRASQVEPRTSRAGWSTCFEFQRTGGLDPGRWWAVGLLVGATVRAGGHPSRGHKRADVSWASGGESRGWVAEAPATPLRRPGAGPFARNHLLGCRRGTRGTPHVSCSKLGVAALGPCRGNRGAGGCATPNAE